MMRKLAFILTAVFIFSIPWEDTYTIGSLGSVSRLLGLLATATWMLSILTTRKLRSLHPFYFALLLFFVWNLASILWTQNFAASNRRLNTYLQLMILSYLLWDQITTETQLKVILQAYLFGCLVSIFNTVMNFKNGIEAFQYSGGRYVANGFNANDLAIILVLGLPIAWYLIHSRGKEKPNAFLTILNILFIPADLFAIMLTGSRDGFLCTILVFIFFAFSLKDIQLWKKIFTGVILILLVIATFFLIPTETIMRLSTTFSSISTGDLGGRTTIYRDAATFVNQVPVMGIGTGAFNSVSTLRTLAHNTFLSILTETGVIGLLLFISLLLIVFVECFKMYGLKRWFWITMLAVWALGVSSVSWEFRKPTWFVLNMIVISVGISFNQQMASVEENHPSLLKSPLDQMNEQGR